MSQTKKIPILTESTMDSTSGDDDCSKEKVPRAQTQTSLLSFLTTKGLSDAGNVDDSASNSSDQPSNDNENQLIEFDMAQEVNLKKTRI